MLSIVDNRAFKRLVYDVLDHDPRHEDIGRFFQRFQNALAERNLKVLGITTDASPLYPEPIREVFGPVPHQLCQFHVIAKLTKAVLHAVARARQALKARLPQLARGRPATAAQKAKARRKQQLEKRIGDLFEHRHLFVKRCATRVEQRTLAGLWRGQPRLRAVRAIMNEIYGLFDRRCRTASALEKLARLRRRVGALKSLGKTLRKLFSPNLEKALTFLDETLLPSTSNAVERGNRRHRKMQKTVYRVRGQQQIQGRIALDMQRDTQGQGREQTIGILHYARAHV